MGSEKQTTRLSSRGRLIVPKKMLELKHWEAGTEFTVEFREDGILLRPVARFPRTTLDQVVGCVGYAGQVKSLEEMEEGSLRLVRERHSRG